MSGNTLHQVAGHSPPVSFDGITEGRLGDLVLLTPIGQRSQRRVLYVNSYGGREVWDKIRAGKLPPHHLWGCLELVRMGYEVALAEPIRHFDFRRPLPHDLSLLSSVREWLRPADILYSAHTLLYWLPLLKYLGLARCNVVSLTYARENLDFPGAHSAIVALTPAAAKKAAIIAPKAKVAHLGWGADLAFFPRLPYAPGWFLSCGKTHRDHYTLGRAATICGLPLRVISPSLPADIQWPPTTTLDTGGQYDDTVSYDDLLRNFYARCSASLIILNDDPEERTAVGFTNLIEAMAMSRPVIVTRTGALPGELDVEASKCGLFVPSKDSAALAAAIARIEANPALACEWGENGRRLAETHYNIGRFAKDLHRLFLSL
jgi:hypothetical protein